MCWSLDFFEEHITAIFSELICDIGLGKPLAENKGVFHIVLMDIYIVILDIADQDQEL